MHGSDTATSKLGCRSFALYLLTVKFVSMCSLFHIVHWPIGIGIGIGIGHGKVVILGGQGSAMPNHVDSIEGECYPEQDAVFS